MLRIHGVPLSIHTRKVIVAALEKRVPYEIDPVFPFDPPAGWSDISPTGLIPAITDDGFHLADSSVIVAYLDRKYPDRPLAPAAPRDFAQALWIEEYVDSGVARDVIAIFHQRVLGPRLHGQAPDEKIVAERVEGTLPGRFDYLEKALHGDFFAGGALSIADITLASSLTMYHYLGFRLDRKRHPRLSAHFDRLLARPTWQAATRDEQPFAARMELDAGFLRERAASTAAA
jgi:glutathione S-transferase